MGVEGVWLHQLFPRLGLAGAHVACSAWACFTGQPSSRAGSGLTHPRLRRCARPLLSASTQALRLSFSFSDLKTIHTESLLFSFTASEPWGPCRGGRAWVCWPDHPKGLPPWQHSRPLVTQTEGPGVSFVSLKRSVTSFHLLSLNQAEPQTNFCQQGFPPLQVSPLLPLTVSGSTKEAGGPVEAARWK